MTFSCSSCCSHFPTQTRHVYPETATAALKARPRVASKCLKTFSFFHFSLAGHKLVSPDLCLNLGASKGFTTSLLCAQRSSVRQPWSQINLHYGNRENYKGNDNCLERYVTMRLDLSTWPLVRFLLQVHLSVFCLLWQHYYRLSGNLNLQAEDRLTWSLEEFCIHSCRSTVVTGPWPKLTSSACLTQVIPTKHCCKSPEAAHKLIQSWLQAGIQASWRAASFTSCFYRV